MARSAGYGSSLAAWDARVTDGLVGARTAGWDRVFWCFSLLGDTPVMAALTSTAVLLLLVWGRRARAALVAGALLSAQGASDLAKALVHRARPPEAIALVARPGSFSLPSGHAFLTLVFFGLLVFLAFRAWRVRRRWLPSVVAILAATVVVLVGLSRVYLGVHWASDVLAGWGLGGAWLALSLGLFQIWEGGSRSLRDSRPRGGKVSRASLTVVLALVTAIAVFLAAGADPLLAPPLP
jgi:membrane-associated phospholipid phosphatase